jgi:hypothetical protein
MVDAISGTASGVEIDKPRVAPSSVAAEAPVTANAASEVRGISPRMNSDPVSGVLITEYLSAEGDVQMQIPSEATVAYLRSGLTEGGRTEKEGLPTQGDSTVLV